MEAVTIVIASGNLTMRWEMAKRIIMWEACKVCLGFLLGILCLYAGKIWEIS